MTSVCIFVSVFFDCKYVCILHRRTCSNELTHTTHVQSLMHTHALIRKHLCSKLLNNLNKRLKYQHLLMC